MRGLKLDEMLRERIAEYWSIAYAEGREGRTQDTEDGAAQATWHAIDGLIKSLVADSAKWQGLCEAQELLIGISAKQARREINLMIGDGNADDQG